MADQIQPLGGLSTIVLLRSPFELSESGRVKEALSRVVGHVRDSRGRRHWWFYVNRAIAWCSVRDIRHLSYHFEVERIKSPFAIEQTSDTFLVNCTQVAVPIAPDVITASTDHDALRRIANELADAFDGIDCGLW